MPARQRLLLPAPDPDPWADLANLLAAMTRPEREDWLAQLPPEVHGAALRALARVDGWRSNPALMAAHLDATLEAYRYFLLLGERFKALVRGESRRQIWMLPARIGKSTISSRWGPTWALDDDPTRLLIITGYGDELAIEHGRFVRDAPAVYPELGYRVQRGASKADRWYTTEGGGVLASGIDGGMTGFGADGAVIDDPFKHWAEAHSAARRTHVVNQYRSVVRLRLNDEGTGWILVNGTRWHEHDLHGFLIAADEAGDGEGWEVVRLPALAEVPNPKGHTWERHPDPLGRAPGEPIEPRRFTKAEVESRARALGSYLAAAMEQQRPAPEEGGEVPRGWWRWYPAAELPDRWDQRITSWDMKMTERESGSYVVGQAWARVGARFYCLWQLRGQWNLPTVKAAIAWMATRYPAHVQHLVENTGNGPEVMRDLRAGHGPTYAMSPEVRSALGIPDDEVEPVNRVLRAGLSGLLPRNPQGDKVARLRAVVGLIEAGDVLLPEAAMDTWAGLLVNEAAVFPAEPNDQVDACSQALAYLRGDAAQVGRATASTGRASSVRPGAPRGVVTAVQRRR